MGVPATVPGYDKLADVLTRAYQQAANGKGKERHANDGVPFEEQPMSAINGLLGSTDGFLYQAMKKAVESKRLPKERAVAELFGAINYLAGAVIALERTTGTGLDVAKLMTDLKSEGGKAQTIEDLRQQVIAEKNQARDNIIQQVAAQSNALGWIEWQGGRQPVDNVQVEYRLRRSSAIFSGFANNLTWYWGNNELSPNDIVEYRIIR